MVSAVHELSLALAVVRLVARDAGSRGMERVTAVRLRLGEQAGVLPQALRLAFACAARDTPLAAASLTIETCPARALCAACALEFSPEAGLLVCPRCFTPGVRLLAGREMEVVGYEGSQPD